MADGMLGRGACAGCGCRRDTYVIHRRALTLEAGGPGRPLSAPQPRSRIRGRARRSLLPRRDGRGRGRARTVPAAALVRHAAACVCHLSSPSRPARPARPAGQPGSMAVPISGSVHHIHFARQLGPPACLVCPALPSVSSTDRATGMAQCRTRSCPVCACIIIFCLCSPLLRRGSRLCLRLANVPR